MNIEITNQDAIESNSVHQLHRSSSSHSNIALNSDRGQSQEQHQERAQQFQGRWELRWHPLREEWVVMAAHRQNRPWRGDTITDKTDHLPSYDPTCYLCPGNERVSGERNPDYTTTHVFDNDHPAIGLYAPTELEPPPGIYRNRPATGIARVVCYTPKHNQTLAEVDPVAVENLISTWQRETVQLSKVPEIQQVTIFENKGEVCGVSNPHAHGQIYATNFIFDKLNIEIEASRRHQIETGNLLFQDILSSEQIDGQRILYENETAVAFIPYFARYAYEVYLAPKASHPYVSNLSDTEAADLADALQKVTIKFDNLWQISFPYMMMLHQAPTNNSDYGFFHFHIEFYPPLRRPNLLKYLGSPETGGGNFLSDTVPSEKAAELRELSTVHYKKVNDDTQ
ncbi:galactose-1-phosphate uridylyltransferase [Chloroflexi bacterium TSY]|nr:galactose-1-phosphate uridylyltransferase [Chloroflexi bacterium TSY]